MPPKRRIVVKRAKKSMPKAQAKAKPARNPSSMDQAAMAYRRLLDDPCGAALSQPLYAGTGSGYLCRTRQIITPPATAVDYLLAFAPSAGSANVLRNGWAATSGAALGTVSANGSPTFLVAGGVVGSYRCVSACIKVVYYGSELNRAGRVYLTYNANQQYFTTQVLSGAPSYVANFTSANRLGEVKHEVRWAPSMADSNWIANGTASTGTVPILIDSGAEIAVIVQGMPAASTEFEITAVWEWQPNNTSTGLTASTSIAESRNTLTDVLRTLGSIADWAVSPASSSARYLLGAAMSTAFKTKGTGNLITY